MSGEGFLKNMIGGALKGATASFIEALGLSEEELRELAMAAASQAHDLNGLISSADLEGAFDTATHPRLSGAPKRAALLKLAALAIRSAREIKT